MTFHRQPALEQQLLAAPALLAARTLVHLGRFDAAAERLDTLAPAHPGVGLETAMVATARGEYLTALQILEEGAADPETRRTRAAVLAALGRIDAALAEIADLDDAESALLRADVHLTAGEPQPASAELTPEVEYERFLSVPQNRRGWDLVARAAYRLIQGDIELALGRGGSALAHFGQARDFARASGAATQLARAWSGIGIAHAGLGHRWRALRAVTHGLDLASSGTVAARRIATVHYRAWAVYQAFEHPDLANQAIQSGHHRIIQMATGIDVREYRESFFLDNRDNQRLVAAWKGEAGWGADIPRG